MVGSILKHADQYLHLSDNVCIESLSIDLTRPMLDSAARSVNKLNDKIAEIKENDAKKLEDEYAKLVEGLQEANVSAEDEDMLVSPVLSKDMVDEAVPGNIRKAEHFIAFLKRFIEYLKVMIPWNQQAGLTFADEDARVACCSRDTSIIPGSFKGNNVYRATASQVSGDLADLVRNVAYVTRPDLPLSALLPWSAHWN